MSQQFGDNPVAFLSTHPSNSRRIERLTEEMPTFQRYYRKSKTQRGRGETLAAVTDGP